MGRLDIAAFRSRTLPRNGAAGRSIVDL